MPIVILSGPGLDLENDLGFDDLLEGLPNDNLFVLQFKRPFERNDGLPCFTIDVPQLQTLLDRFRALQVFYVLSSFTQTNQRILQHNYKINRKW
jgi:hypothetical protein